MAGFDFTHATVPIMEGTNTEEKVAMGTTAIAAVVVPILGDEGAVVEGGNIAANAAKGKAFQDAVFAEKAAADPGAVQNLTLKTQSGVKTVMDVVNKDASGATKLTEAKSSATARLTSNQTKAHPEIQQTGATVVGKGKPGYPGGTAIPPTKVDVVRPKTPDTPN